MKKHLFSNVILGLSMATLSLSCQFIDPYSGDTWQKHFEELLTPPPVAYYPFSGDSNDYSGNGNHLTIDGVGVLLTTDRFGSAGSAYQFGGSGAFLITDAGGFADAAPPWTITAWVYLADNASPRALVGTTGLPAIKAVQFGSPSQEVGITNGIDQYWNYSIPLNTWIHLRFVNDGSAVELYANNVSQGTLTGNAATLGMPFSSIGSTWTNSDRFVGSIDEVTFYNEAVRP